MTMKKFSAILIALSIFDLSSSSLQKKELPWQRLKFFFCQGMFLLLVLLNSALYSQPIAKATCDQYVWGVWTDQGSTNSATATLDANGQTINMLMTANYNFSFTSGIFNYGAFSGYADNPPNSTVPLTTWSVGAGGTTTMCFSQWVQNPVLLLASIGAPSVPVTLSFSIPYTVLYDGGGCNFITTTSLIGAEGFCILEFPGTFNCVTVYSTTPEYYTNLTWGIKIPPVANFTYTQDCISDSIHFAGFIVNVVNPVNISSWQWNFGDGTTSNLQNPSHLYTNYGNYDVQLVVTTINNCVDTITQSISVISPPNITLGNDTSICSGQSLTLQSPQTFSSYLWSTNDTTQSIVVNAAGVYWLRVTNALGCEEYDTIAIAINTNLLVSISASANPICAGASSNLSAYGASSYQWGGGLGTSNLLSVTPASTTTYSVTGNSLGCTATSSITITVNPMPTISITAAANPICLGDSTILTSIGASTYLWSGGFGTSNPLTISPTTTTTYTVIGLTLGCSTSSSIAITVNPHPSLTIAAAPNPICVGLPAILTASGASTYLWSLGLGTANPITVAPNATTTYTLTGTTAGCTATASITLTVNPNPIISISALPNPICLGEPSTLTANSNMPSTSYNWFNNSNTNSVIVSPGLTTYYYVIGTANNCKDSVGITLVVRPDQTIDLGADAYLCKGDAINLSAPNLLGAYLWSNGSNATTITITEPGIYWLRVDNSGCITSDTIVYKPCSEIWVPNVMTPNADGKNDSFKPVTSQIDDLTIYIYNRWGTLIFQTTDFATGWNGTIQGKNASDGVYYWVIRYKDNRTNSPETLKEIHGTVTLLR